MFLYPVRQKALVSDDQRKTGLSLFRSVSHPLDQDVQRPTEINLQQLRLAVLLAEPDDPREQVALLEPFDIQSAPLCSKVLVDLEPQLGGLRETLQSVETVVDVSCSREAHLRMVPTQSTRGEAVIGFVHCEG